ncbi:MAG: biotin carboxylase N-terminal domain-containing protein [Pseudomonadota bacterium]
MFQRILIANRGEIACRIIRTARRMGIETVAVYSEADAGARHVAEADFAVAIGAASASASYLRAERIIEAAVSSGAQAIHPGYGFLSEKLELIDACEKHGIQFVGPNRRAIESMGSKIESKRMARAAGVVCVPGYDEDDQSPVRLRDEAGKIGFPLLIKASAGGGGKGMRRVNAADEFDAMLALARKEALAAFGDERVLLEKYIVNPRHLEVQLVGDRHGHLVHLFERECSIQRRFQKVIEEAPANHLPTAVAEKLYEAALRMGQVMGYDNAGTVEFVLDADQGDTPYFLEVNTRLQVEHPVTELTTGIDLVEWQLRVAAGEALPLTQNEIHRSGWAMECRLNAEEPEHDYRASLGPLIGYAEPDKQAGVRIDSGLHACSEVTPYYDSMLAKVIGFGATRAEATARVRLGVEQLRIEGVRTNASLLLQILQHPEFSAVLTTRFLDQHFPNGPLPEVQQRQAHVLAVAAAWSASQPVHNPVWGGLRSFRITAPSVGIGRGAAVNLQLSDVSATTSEAVQLMQTGGVYWLPAQPELQARVVHGAQGWEVAVCEGGVLVATVHVQHTTGQRWFSWALGQSRVWDIEHDLAHSLNASSAQSQGNNLSASLPGRISEVMVQAGDTVAAGDPVLTLEAMKLYHGLSAPVSGTVRQVHVKLGDIVGQGHLLVEIEPAPDNTETK